MFARIMAVVLAVILLLTAGFSVLGVISLRQERVNSQLETLKTEAREIAYLASLRSDTGNMWYSFYTNSTSGVLQWKAQQVYDTYGAYIAVVDRWGRVMDNIRLTTQNDPDFAASLNSTELSEAMGKVLAGEEIAVRVMVSGNPMFTVGVPFMQDGRVLGAVLIRTPARTIEGSTWEFARPLITIALAALLLSGLAIFFYIRRVMRPLHALTRAAEEMAGGDFTARVPEEHNLPREIGGVAQAFNTMADRLGDTERSRREFVANVSHELKSPITSISGFVQGMEDGTIPPEEHPEYLGLVGAETRRLSKLIGDLLALSRLEREDASLQYSAFDMCEMLRRAVIRRVSDLEQRSIDIDCDFRADPCPAWADADRMEQVVVNLMDNAIKFTPEGGRITLTTEDSGDRWTVTVADNGPGILPEDRPHVFERFFTADRAHTAGKGTGLGLSICQQILRMHGEKIWLKDVPEGTAFAFTLAKAGKEAALPHDA